MRALVWTLAAVWQLSATGCGSCGGGNPAVDGSPDGPVADATGADGPAIDGPAIDGTASSGFAGLITIDEVSVQDHAELGHGGLISIAYRPLPGVAPVYDDRDAQGFGCAAWLYDLSDGIVPIAVDEGTVAITGTTAAVPSCTFFPGMGYHCPAGSGTGGTGDSIADDPGGPGTAGLVDAVPSGYTFNVDDVGRYIWITGATTWNSGLFPIVGVDTGTNTIIYSNPQALPQATFVGSYLVMAGGGPVPGGPEFVADTDDVQVSLAAGGGGHVNAFTLAVNAGDAFALDAASQTAIISVPFDGSALGLRCAAGQCGSAMATVVNIVTTDGTIEPGPDYTFPDPADRSAVIHCMSTDTEIVVPTGAMFAVASAAANRIRTTYRRVGLGTEQNADDSNPTQVLVGHGIIGYADPPPPPPDAGVDAPPDADLPDATASDAFICAPDLGPLSDGSSAARQALMISEVNPGDYIELYNNTGADMPLSTVPYYFCSPFNYCEIAALAPGVTVPAHGYATVPWPLPGSGCFANFVDGNSGGELILFLTGTFSIDDNIMDFVCWGTGHPGAFSRKTQAEATGKWTGGCAPAVTGGALHRIIGTDGVNASDHDTTSPSTPMNCTP